MFSTLQVCLECKDAEEKDPRYEEARKAEHAAVKRGDFNFPGIGEDKLTRK
jgi:hypothetical protein